jgi:gliding motility-associated-like protein
VDAAMATSSAPVAMPSSTTTFTVTGTSSEADGSCTGEGEVTVTVTNQGAFFPLAFSPNGDGDNEVWEITGNDPDCLMTIFDGRGRRIFEKKSENWDGTFDGKPVPEGTYYYVYGCPNAKPVTGTVLVFR